MNARKPTPHVALVADGEGGHMAVRFPSMEALCEWEDRTGVYVALTCPIATRADAIKASR